MKQMFRMLSAQAVICLLFFSCPSANALPALEDMGDNLHDSAIPVLREMIEENRRLEEEMAQNVHHGGSPMIGRKQR